MNTKAEEFVEIVLRHPVVVSAYTRQLCEVMTFCAILFATFTWIAALYGFWFTQLFLVGYWEIVIRAVSVEPTIRWVSYWTDTDEGEKVVRKILDQVNRRDAH